MQYKVTPVLLILVCVLKRNFAKQTRKENLGINAQKDVQKAPGQ